MSRDLGSDDVGESALQRGNDALGVVDAERRLRHVGDRRVGGDVELFDLLLVLHQHHGPGIWPIVPSTSGWPAWPIRISLRPCADIALALIVHLGDQRAGRIEHRQIARRRLLLDALRDAMRAEHRDGVRRDFGELLDEHRALGLEALDDDVCCARSRGARRPAARISAARARRSRSRAPRRRKIRAAEPESPSWHFLWSPRPISGIDVSIATPQLLHCGTMSLPERLEHFRHDPRWHRGRPWHTSRPGCPDR